jgi:hypothetical protein
MYRSINSFCNNNNNNKEKEQKLELDDQSRRTLDICVSTAANLKCFYYLTTLHNVKITAKMNHPGSIGLTGENDDKI